MSRCPHCYQGGFLFATARSIVCRYCGWTGAAPTDAAPSGPPSRVSGKIVGFRSWTLDGYRLLSANRALKGYWTIGENKAECRRHLYAEAMGYPGVRYSFPTVLEDRHHDHPAPDPDCECGLYAFHEPSHLGNWDDPAGVIHGAVTAWGRMEVHTDGFRAEYAEPVVLAYKPTQPYEVVKRAEAIAGEMALPFVSFNELQLASQGYGRPVPSDLVPERPSRDVYQGYFGIGTVRAYIPPPPPIPVTVSKSSRATGEGVQPPQPAPASRPGLWRRLGSRLSRWHAAAFFCFLMAGINVPGIIASGSVISVIAAVICGLFGFWAW